MKSLTKIASEKIIIIIQLRRGEQTQWEGSANYLLCTGCQLFAVLLTMAAFQQLAQMITLILVIIFDLLLIETGFLNSPFLCS